MGEIRDGWNSQLASDIHRDGMGLELLNPAGDVVAEIFRCERDRIVIISTFNKDIPLQVFNVHYREALVRLDPFEDDTSFESVGIV